MAMGFGFGATVFAMTQGEFQRTTRQGLVSLVITLVVLAALLYSGKTLVHLHLPPGN